jgi:hypothetical protein
MVNHDPTSGHAANDTNAGTAGRRGRRRLRRPWRVRRPVACPQARGLSVGPRWPEYTERAASTAECLALAFFLWPVSVGSDEE